MRNFQPQDKNQKLPDKVWEILELNLRAEEKLIQVGKGKFLEKTPLN